MANTPKHQDRGHETTQKPGDMASNVADKAKNMASAAAGQAQNVMNRASDMASDTVASVGGQMRTLANTIRENVPQEGMVGSAAAAVANTLESGVDYLEGQSLSDIGEDLSGVIRNYPLASVMVGVGFGFLLGRTLRS